MLALAICMELLANHTLAILNVAAWRYIDVDADGLLRKTGISDLSAQTRCHCCNESC